MIGQCFGYCTLLLLGSVIVATAVSPSRLVDTLNVANATHASPTASPTALPTPVSTSELIAFCLNLTNCGSCMASQTLYGVSCAWQQYGLNHCVPSSQCDGKLESESESESASDSYCCEHGYCCDCLSQSSCKMCGAQGLNSSCTWDESVGGCFEGETCVGPSDTCVWNPLLTECEYPSGACEFYFSESGTTLWTLGYMGMVIFLICLPCCLYHKCGVDWDTEFSIPISDEYALQQGDGYVFKGGAHITGRCMYTTFLCIGFACAMLAIFGTILSISCIAESY